MLPTVNKLLNRYFAIFANRLVFVQLRSHADVLDKYAHISWARRASSFHGLRSTWREYGCFGSMDKLTRPANEAAVISSNVTLKKKKGLPAEACNPLI